MEAWGGGSASGVCLCGDRGAAWAFFLGVFGAFEEQRGRGGGGDKEAGGFGEAIIEACGGDVEVIWGAGEMCGDDLWGFEYACGWGRVCEGTDDFGVAGGGISIGV